MRGEQETQRAMELYADMVFRLCLMHLKNHADAEDAFQTVFLKYALCSVVFESPEHEKAWFIRVALNACRDILRQLFRRRTLPLEEAAALPAEAPQRHRELWEAVLRLPPKCRDAVYLHYYEGYTAPEIGRLLHKNVNTVYTLLHRAKAQLREALGGDADDE